MRRKDILLLIIIALVINYAAKQLRLPVVRSGSVVTVDNLVLSTFSKWSSHALVMPVSAANGQVKGSSTDVGNPEKPQSLLPVETYYGSPLMNSIHAMLESAGVTVNKEDIVEAFPLPELGIGSTIHVYRATPVEVIDWGKKQSYRTWQQDVGTFLAEQSIELGENDRVEPTSNMPLTLAADQLAHLKITRVAITEVKVVEKIDFKTKETDDPDLPRGQKKVAKGQLGKREKLFRVTRENGLEVKRLLLKNEVILEPKDELIIVGTKVIIGESYTGRASWYKYTSTKVATDHFKRGVQLRITNLDNGKVIFVKNDGCICADTGYVVDLHPDHFKALGGVIRDGVMKRVKIDEVLN